MDSAADPDTPDDETGPDLPVPQGEDAGEAERRLSRTEVLLLTLASAVVTANAYYIHPIISEVAAAFDVGHGLIGIVPGANQIALALGVCGSVTLYGFGNDSHPNSSSACRHYYDCKFSQKRYFSGKMGFHNWHHQWRVLARWIGTGK